VQCLSRKCAYRRGLNSHDAAKPRENLSPSSRGAKTGARRVLTAKDGHRQGFPRGLRASEPVGGQRFAGKNGVGLKGRRQPVRRSAAARSSWASSLFPNWSVNSWCARQLRARSGRLQSLLGRNREPSAGQASALVIERVLPNPSLKRTANGGPPGPRGAVVYPAPRGPGVPPSSTA
jgi:hypothetical protein